MQRIIEYVKDPTEMTGKDDLDDLLIEQFKAAGDAQWFNHFEDDRHNYIVNKLWLRNLARIAYNQAVQDTKDILYYNSKSVEREEFEILNKLIKKI